MGDSAHLIIVDPSSAGASESEGSVAMQAMTTTTLMTTLTANLSGNASNETEFWKSDAEINKTFKLTIVVLYVLVTCAALLGNGCVVYLVLSQRSMRNVTNYFIASLAVSDALMALVCIPITFVSNVLFTSSWPFPAWMCNFATYFQVCFHLHF
jgi:hypothetical protein